MDVAAVAGAGVWRNSSAAIIQAILAGQQPRCMSLLWFQRNPLPTDWVAQRAVVAGFDA